ncbi:MAG TPA: DMT family transporter [Gemmatimonadales bacterium]|nr:DMT family transporter [Gemmatimonadales bacterium]
MTRKAWVLFALSSVIWGIPYLFIKVAVDGGVPPAFVAWARVALGALLLTPIALRRGAFSGLGEHWIAILVYSATEIAIPFVLISAGEQRISSSLAAILVSTMPLQLAVLAVWLHPEHRPTGWRLMGLVIGLAGVVAMLGIDVGGRPGELWGAAMVLLATVGYATAPLIISRYLSKLDPMGPVAASLLVSSLALLPFALAWPPRAWPAPSALISLAVLGVVCTVMGLIVFFQLIATAGPSRASLITYVNPVVAVIVGVLTLHEHVGIMSVAGLVLILGGSWLAT